MTLVDDARTFLKALDAERRADPERFARALGEGWFDPPFWWIND